MKKTGVLLSVMAALPLCGASIEQRTEAREFTPASGAVFRYRWAEKTPSGGGDVPLVLFLHGAGERGDDNKSQLRHGVADIVAWLDANEEGFKFVAGQVPAGKRWVEVDWGKTSHTMPEEPSETMASLIELADSLVAAGGIDTNRIYATGISMGGYGTWDIASRRPEMFAAVMPICGGADVAQAQKLAALPIWTFHGSKDPTVPVVRSRSILIALWQAGSDAHYREYPDAVHDVWTRTYRDSEVLEWFFAQNKAGAASPGTGGGEEPSSPVRLESESYTLESTALAAKTVRPETFTIAPGASKGGLDRILAKCGGMGAHLDIGEFVRVENSLLALHNADGSLGAGEPGAAQSVNITASGGIEAIGGAAGTTGAAIVPWARGCTVGDLKDNYFTQLVACDAEKGLRFLDPATEYETIATAQETPYEPSEGANLRVTAAGAVQIKGGCTVNSFSMLSPNAAAVTVSPGTMRITSGVLDMSCWNTVSLAGDFDFGEATGYVTQCAQKSATLYGSIAGRDVVFGDNALDCNTVNAPLVAKGTATFTGDLYVNGSLTVEQASFLPCGERKGNIRVNGRFLPNGGTMNGLFGGGTVDKPYTGTATLTIGDNDADGDFSGTIKNSKGNFNLVKKGAGTQRLGGTVAIGGTLTVSGGTLLVDGTLSAKSIAVDTANGANFVVDVPAGATEMVRVVSATTSLEGVAFTRGENTARLELREDGKELWAVPGVRGFYISISKN